MATSIAPTTLTAVVDLLAAREGLTGVQVTSGPMPSTQQGGKYLAKEKIEFHEIHQTQEFAGFGKVPGKPSRAEQFTITGLVEANADGAGEPAIREARSRAYELVAEVENCMRDNLHAGGVLWTHYTRGDCRQGVGDAYRWCQILIELSGQSRL